MNGATNQTMNQSMSSQSHWLLDR